MIPSFLPEQKQYSFTKILTLKIRAVQPLENVKNNLSAIRIITIFIFQLQGKVRTISTNFGMVALPVQRNSNYHSQLSLSNSATVPRNHIQLHMVQGCQCQYATAAVSCSYISDT